jgi:hypothetical protein
MIVVFFLINSFEFEYNLKNSNQCLLRMNFGANVVFIIVYWETPDSHLKKWKKMVNFDLKGFVFDYLVCSYGNTTALGRIIKHEL